MTCQNFIKENMTEIDLHIKGLTGKNQYQNNEERRLWILNDEGLYHWARIEGVNI